MELSNFRLTNIQINKQRIMGNFQATKWFACPICSEFIINPNKLKGPIRGLPIHLHPSLHHITYNPLVENKMSSLFYPILDLKNTPGIIPHFLYQVALWFINTLYPSNSSDHHLTVVILGLTWLCHIFAAWYLKF